MPRFTLLFLHFLILHFSTNVYYIFAFLHFPFWVPFFGLVFIKILNSCRTLYSLRRHKHVYVNIQNIQMLIYKICIFCSQNIPPVFANFIYMYNYSLFGLVLLFKRSKHLHLILKEGKTLI